MAETESHTFSDLVAMVNEQSKITQTLMSQQAETEEAFNYQVRDLQKQIIGLRKQRADDASHYEEEIRTLQKQLATADLRNEDLQSRVQHLTKDVRTSATNAATEVEEKANEVQKEVEDVKRAMVDSQDDIDVQLESLGSRFRQMKDDIRNINLDTIAKAVAESDLKGRSVTKMRSRLDEIEIHMKAIDKTSASLSKRMEGFQGEIDRCKTTFFFIDEATKPHVEKKPR